MLRASEAVAKAWISSLKGKPIGAAKFQNPYKSGRILISSVPSPNWAPKASMSIYTYTSNTCTYTHQCSSVSWAPAPCRHLQTRFQQPKKSQKLLETAALDSKPCTKLKPYALTQPPTSNPDPQVISAKHSL